MSQKTIDPNQLSDIELKALAYDMLVQAETVNKNLQAINQLIAERARGAAALPEAVAKTVE